MSFWLNGRICDETVAVDIADRGFLLGDGLFETILLVDGFPAFLSRHLARLRASAAALKFGIAHDDAEIREAISGLAHKNGLANGAGAARITLTRGPAGRGLALPSPGKTPSTLLITAAPYNSAAGQPLRLIISAYRRAENTVAAAHKALSYLDNIMARHEAVAAGADDAILLNSAGRAACASAANVFLITQKKEVITPPVSEGALPGIVRSVLLEEASKGGVAISEAPIESPSLDNARLFLTNSLMGVQPAALANGAAGVGTRAEDILKRLQSCYGDALRRDLNGE